MKYSVADFYHSQTMKAYFANLSLPPVIECILINRSKHSIFDKIEALSERYEAYSEEDFEITDYNLKKVNGKDYKKKLGEYIAFIKQKADLIKKPMPGIYYDVSLICIEQEELDDIEFRSFSKALRYARTKGEGNNIDITRRNRNDGLDINIYNLTRDYQVYRFTCLDQIYLDSAKFELPHVFHAGDRLKWGYNSKIHYAIVQSDTGGESEGVVVKLCNCNHVCSFDIDELELASEDE